MTRDLLHLLPVFVTTEGVQRTKLNENETLNLNDNRTEISCRQLPASNLNVRVLLWLKELDVDMM